MFKRQFHHAVIACTVTLASAIVSSSVSGAEAVFPAGEYRAGKIAITFDASGHVRLTGDSGPLVDGEFTASGNQIRLTDRSGPMACPSAQTGVYRWSLVRDALTFSKVDDPCDGRSGDLTAQHWKREK